MIPLSRIDSTNFAVIPGKANKINSNRLHYRMFDFCLESDIELPGLAVTGAGSADLSIMLRAAGLVPQAGLEWFHEWRDRDGELAICAARRGSEYLLRFPEMADFTFQSSTKVIGVFPQPGCEPHTLNHLLLDQVIPRVLNQLGRLVLHASCIELAPGKAVAFLGNTGQGKSTLASSFWQAGFALITDDSLLLERINQGYCCTPGYPSLRLWPDAADSLVPAGQAFHSVAQYTDKKQILIGPQTNRATPVARQLVAFFVLKEGSRTDELCEVEVTSARGADTAIEIIESMFTLDVDCQATIRRNFDLAGQVLGSDLPIFRLEYVRRFDQLPGVRERILDAVRDHAANR